MSASPSACWTDDILAIMLLCCCAGEQQLLEKRMAAAGFDLDRYHQLMRTRDRYKRYMAAKVPVGQHTDTVAAAAAAAGAATDGKLKYS